MVFYICSYRLNGVGGSVPERVSCRPGHGTQGFGTSGQPNGEREDIRRVIGRPLPSSLIKKTEVGYAISGVTKLTNCVTFD